MPSGIACAKRPAMMASGVSSPGGSAGGIGSQTPFKVQTLLASCTGSGPGAGSPAGGAKGRGDHTVSGSSSVTGLSSASHIMQS